MVNYPIFLFWWMEEDDIDYGESLYLDSKKVFNAVEAACVWAGENLLDVVPAEYRNAEPLTVSLPLKGVVFA